MSAVALAAVAVYAQLGDTQTASGVINAAPRMEVLCGDQNGDGEVNVFDVIIDLQITVGLIEPTAAQLFLSDLNQDGTVNVFDAIMGLQHIVGIIPSLDECGPE